MLQVAFSTLPCPARKSAKVQRHHTIYDELQIAGSTNSNMITSYRTWYHVYLVPYVVLYILIVPFACLSSFFFSFSGGWRKKKITTLPRISDTSFVNLAQLHWQSSATSSWRACPSVLMIATARACTVPGMSLVAGLPTNHLCLLALANNSAARTGGGHDSNVTRQMTHLHVRVAGGIDTLGFNLAW